MVVAAAIPFEQHEFAPVLASLFFTTKDVRQLVNVARTRCQQDFQCVFGRGLQVAAVSGKRDELRVGNAVGAQLFAIDFDDAACGKEGADSSKEGSALVQALAQEVHVRFSGL